MKKILPFVFALFSCIAFSQTTYDWLNTAPDGNWRQGAFGARWNPGGLFDEPPFGILRFNNNHQLTMTNNVPGTYNTHQIVFGSFNTSNRTITGTGIVRLFDNSGADPKIENLSTGSHTISFNISADGDATDPLEINPVNGDLTFNNTISNLGSPINIFGNNGFTARFNNIISGAGAFIIRQNSKVIFNADNIYTGNTELDNGELWIETTGNAIANNNIFLGNGGLLANVAKIFLSRTAGGTTFSRNININPGNANTRFLGGLNTSGTNTFSGNIIRSAAQPLNIEVVNAGGTVAFTGLINGSGNITKVGPGTATLTTTNATFTGNLVVENGTFSVDGFPNRINSRPITLGATSTSGTFRFTTTSGASTGLTLTTAAGGGTIENNSTTGFSFSGTNTLNGTITYNASNTGNITLSGIHSGTGGLTVASTSTGRVILGANNTYTGATRVNSGILEINGITRIANTSNMILAGGTFSTGSTSGNTEQVGTLQLLGNSTISLGAGSHTLTFANSNAVAWTGGTTLTITGWEGTPGATGIGSSGRIQIGVGGLTATQLAQINFTGYANGAVLTATGEVVPSDYIKYYSKGSLAPNVLANWSLTIDGSGASPTSFDRSEFIVQNTHAMVTGAAWTLGTGAKLTIQNGGSLESTFAVTIAANGVFQIDNGGTYFHNNTVAYGTTIYQGTEIFANNSNVVYLRSNATTFAQVSNYGNLTIDVTSGPTATNNFNGTLQNVFGNFTINNFNGFELGFISGAGTNNATIHGNFIVNGGGIRLTNGTSDFTLTVNGNVELNGGTFRFQNTNTGNGILIVAGSTLTITNSVTFSGDVPGSSGFYLNRVGTQNITISNAFTSGAHRDRFFYNTTNVTGINETYNGTVAQTTVTGTGATPLAGYAAFPTAGTVLNNVTVNNSAGLTLRRNLNVNGTLTLTNGIVTLDTNTITVVNTTGISGGSATAYINTNGTGSLIRTVSGTGTYAFPLGSATTYNPASFNWTATPGITQLTGRFTGTSASLGTGLPLQSGCYEATSLLNNGYWTFTETGTLSNNPTVTLTRNGHTNAGATLNSHALIRRTNSSSAWAFAGAWADSGSSAITPANTGQVSLSQNNLSAFGEMNIAVGTLYVTPATPGSITGAVDVCEGSSPQTYSISSVEGATSYTWTVPTGWTINSGQGTLSISVTAGAVGDDGDITVIASNLCGDSAPATLAVTVDGFSIAGTLSSDNAICAGETSGLLTLSGNVGDVVRWESAVAPFTTWDVINNNEVTYTSGALTETTRFRAVVQNGVCSEAISNEVEILISTTTWNGSSWSNGTPNSTTGAVVTGNYSTSANGVFTACSLRVENNATFTLSTGTNITLRNELNIVSGSSFIQQNNANLIQVNDVNNTGTITVFRETNPLMRLDYVLWSSPVSGQNLQAFSPNTVSNRFYMYNSATNQYNVINPASSSFGEGLAYLIRMPNVHPTTPTSWEGDFIGVPHNGDVTLSVTNNTYNGVGNPYPSTIDADTFIIDNGITEALYFWRKTNNANTSSYATYTLAGGAGTSANAGDPLGLIPNGVIQVGQGFIVRSTSTSIVFNNGMRIGDNNNQTFRNAQKSRYWLNMTSEADESVFSQMMIAYMANTTTGVDAAIDGISINDSDYALSSILEDNDYTIQARGNYDVNDVINLRMKAQTPGTYIISLHKVDGFFEEAEAIYLKDNLLGSLHNLKTAPYSFTSESGTFSNRFEIVYQNILGIDNPAENQNLLLAYTTSSGFEIKSSSVDIAAVTVYDLQGRLLKTAKEINQSNYTIAHSDLPNQVYILQIKTIDGKIVSKKVVK